MEVTSNAIPSNSKPQKWGHRNPDHLIIIQIICDVRGILMLVEIKINVSEI